VRILDAAARARRLPRRLPIWWTEYGYQTLPPDPVRGVALDEQADWLMRAELMTWADPRVAALTQFLMVDTPARTWLRRSDPKYWSTYQSGLRFADGRRKPAYLAYALAFDGPQEVRAGSPFWLWGFLRAAPNGQPQQVQLEFREAGAATFAPIGAPIAVTDPHGYFVAFPPRRTGTYRYRWRGVQSHAVTVYVE
jgi:hypothetical protein